MLQNYIPSPHSYAPNYVPSPQGGTPPQAQFGNMPSQGSLWSPLRTGQLAPTTPGCSPFQVFFVSCHGWTIKTVTFLQALHRSLPYHKTTKPKKVWLLRKNSPIKGWGGLSKMSNKMSKMSIIELSRWGQDLFDLSGLTWAHPLTHPSTHR